MICAMDLPASEAACLPLVCSVFVFLRVLSLNIYAQCELLQIFEKVRRCDGPPDSQGDVHHMRQPGYHLGPPGKPPQVVTSIAVVSLNIRRVLLANEMSLRWQHRSKCPPVICMESTALKVLHLVVKSSESCNITTAEHPGHGSPCVTINGLDDPKLLFFDPMKCHISSNCISRMPSATFGSGKLSPNFRIFRHKNA